jgi:hypothetical protein
VKQPRLQTATCDAHGKQVGGRAQGGDGGGGEGGRRLRIVSFELLPGLLCAKRRRKKFAVKGEIRRRMRQGREEAVSVTPWRRNRTKRARKGKL